MNKSAKRYFDWAYEYQVAALTLNTQLPYAPHLYNPIVFLLRHTIELQLKGLIINEAKKHSKVKIRTITIGPKKRKINQTHLLGELWEKYRSLTDNHQGTETISFAGKVIGKLNRKDPWSERYRYPQSKSQYNYDTEPVQLDLVDKAPDLAGGIPYVLITNDVAAVVEKGQFLLRELIDIIEVTEKLFDLAQ